MTEDRITLSLTNPQTAYKQIVDAWMWVKAMLLAGHRLSLEIKKATRTTDQNAMWWSILTDISRQVEWPVNGTTARLDPEEWKHILTASHKREQRVAQGINGGWVMLGQRTSKMTKAEMSELIEIAYAFGAESGVKWSRTSLGRDVEMEAV